MRKNSQFLSCVAHAGHVRQLHALTKFYMSFHHVMQARRLVVVLLAGCLDRKLDLPLQLKGYLQYYAVDPYL